MSRTAFIAVLTLLLGSAAACTTFGSRIEPEPETPDNRERLIARAKLWTPTDIHAVNVKAGPAGKGAFAFRATVYCDYLDKTLGGRSPKFACLIGKEDEVKVKFGGANGEVYGEVLATRLMWALGFGADRMYPVNVICHGCPEEFGGIERPGDESRFDPAVIERTMEGIEWPSEGKPGWSWEELEALDPELGGAPKAHRDALKLLAVFLQHTDSKPEQQRILCLGNDVKDDRCRRPFLMISDVGLTFGRANRSNANEAGSVNLAAWRQTPVWRNETGCTGNLPKSFTGTLENPAISEEGRRFLSNLLAQLTDGQLHDLFEVARVELRLRTPGDVFSGYATVDEWVEAFKKRRNQILDRRCA
jgi:hypothetical protein